MRRIVDTNVRLIAMGYNKLIEEWKAQKAQLRQKLKFVIQSLTDQEVRFKLQAYGGLKERWQM